jgi:hypothetical protein
MCIQISAASCLKKQISPILGILPMLGNYNFFFITIYSNFQKNINLKTNVILTIKKNKNHLLSTSLFSFFLMPNWFFHNQILTYFDHSIISSKILNLKIF